MARRAPCALILLAAVMALGPPLGRALFAPPAKTDIWRPFVVEGAVLPEPTEQARYVIALLGPLLASGGVVLLAGRRVRTRASAALAQLAQAALLLFVAACVLYQELRPYGARSPAKSPGGRSTSRCRRCWWRPRSCCSPPRRCAAARRSSRA